MTIKDHLEENHAHSSAKYLKNIVYGGIDGIITTFSIIAAAYGANLDIRYIITMGFANLIADAFSMGYGDFISTKFENEYILKEKYREEQEFINNKEYEIQEMIELYQSEGFEIDDSNKIVDILVSKDKYIPFFIKRMVFMELGLDVPEKNYIIENRKHSLVTFLSFLIFGFVPVLFYIIMFAISYEENDVIFIIDCFITLLTIFSLGIFQAIITNQSKLMGGLILSFNSIISTSIAFSIGYGLEYLIIHN